jgi:RHS repeat-associated protein
MALLNGSTTLSQANYAYDNASRLASVSDGNGNSGAYSYLANSALVGQITFVNSSATEMTTSKQYDYLNRLSSVSSSPSNSFIYEYNAANQRTLNRLWDGSYWRYQYDTLGQMTAGQRFWSDETPVAGQQFDYAFDTIGNRTQTEAGGDQTGANLRVANYSANNLNQYTQRDVPGYVDIMGDSLATNAVTVNGQAAYQKVEYFRAQLNVTNTAAAVWDGVTVSAPGQSSVTGHQFVAQTPESFTYDADGNLLSDGRWNYTWDGENRLVNMISLSSAPSGSQFQLAFAYDYQGRRIQKIVSTNNGSGTYFGEYTNNYAYDGWNCIAILNPSLNLVNSFMWGSDLSGSMQGAGGVGGLIEVSYYGAVTTNCFVAFDGNGNVSALVNAANGTIAANYEYGPFGELIRATGPMAKLNPAREGTKFYDDETDMAYYGYRFYNPSTGRWLSRDPMGDAAFATFHEFTDDELQGIGDTEGNSANLYGFVANQPLTQWDYLGLTTVGGGVPTRGIFEHNSYLTFTVKCPACQQFVFYSVDYSGAVPALEKLFGKQRVDSLAGPIPPAAGLGGFRGYPNGDGPNCNGKPVKVQVYMRTRFASYTFGTAAGAAAYAAGTVINYNCIPCANGYNPGPGNPVLPNL